jgi:hypothetical protein
MGVTVLVKDFAEIDAVESDYRFFSLSSKKKL